MTLGQNALALEAQPITTANQQIPHPDMVSAPNLPLSSVPGPADLEKIVEKAVLACEERFSKENKQQQQQQQFLHQQQQQQLQQQQEQLQV